jgi:hypothetical protein
MGCTRNSGNHPGGGQAPHDLMPNLYKPVWRKNQSVKNDMFNNNWTRGLWRMTEATEMAELVTMWTMISEVLTDTEDTIKWKWTAHGH